VACQNGREKRILSANTRFFLCLMALVGLDFLRNSLKLRRAFVIIRFEVHWSASGKVKTCVNVVYEPEWEM